MKLAAISWYHRCNELQFPADSRLALLYRGLLRDKSRWIPRLPVTPAILLQIHRGLDLRDQDLSLFWGLILLAYFFMLRGSEFLCQPRGLTYSYAFRLHQLKVTTAAVSIDLSGSKNDQLGRGATRTLQATGHQLLCPVNAAQRIIQAHRHWRHPKDVRITEGRSAGFTPARVAETIKHAASAIGLDQARFSTHSLRIEGATALVSGGACELSTMYLVGRWTSRSFEAYPAVRPSLTRNLASIMTQDF